MHKLESDEDWEQDVSLSMTDTMSYIIPKMEMSIDLDVHKDS